MNQARRNYLRAARINGALGSGREAFACFYLCDACGYLDTNEAHCRACGGRNVIDLGHTPTFHALEDAEGRDHSLRWSRTRRALGIGLAMVGVIVGGLATAVAGSPGAWFALAIVGGIAAGITLAGGSSPTLRRERRRGLAAKWRGPALAGTHRDHESTVVSSGAAGSVRTMESPLAGVPCVAYRVRVRDESGALLLEEHHNLPVEVGSRCVDEGAALVEVQSEPVDAGPRLETVRRWLRARGVRYLDGMRFEEGIVGPTEIVELRVSGSLDRIRGTGVGGRTGYR